MVLPAESETDSENDEEKAVICFAAVQNNISFICSRYTDSAKNKKPKWRSKFALLSIPVFFIFDTPLYKILYLPISSYSSAFCLFEVYLFPHPDLYDSSLLRPIQRLMQSADRRIEIRYQHLAL